MYLLEKSPSYSDVAGIGLVTLELLQSLTMIDILKDSCLHNSLGKFPRENIYQTTQKLY